MGGFHCIAFIEYMILGKTLLDYTNLISPSDYQLNMTNMIKENVASLDFRLKNTDEARHSLFKKIKQWFDEWKAQKLVELYITLNVFLFSFLLSLVAS